MVVALVVWSVLMAGLWICRSAIFGVKGMSMSHVTLSSLAREFVVRSACSCKPGRNGEPPRARLLCARQRANPPTRSFLAPRPFLDLPDCAPRSSLRPLVSPLLSSCLVPTRHAHAPMRPYLSSSYLLPCDHMLPFCSSLPAAPVSFRALRPAPFSCSLLLCSLVDAPRPTPQARTSVLISIPPLRNTNSPVTKVHAPQNQRKTRQQFISHRLYLLSASDPYSCSRHTPLSPEPAYQATRSPLPEMGKNALVRRSPYDSTFALLRLATSSTTRLRAFQHPISPLKPAFPENILIKSLSTYNEFLSIPAPLPVPSSWCLFAPAPLLSPCSLLPILLSLESPLSRTPASRSELTFPPAFRRMRSTLTPKVDLSERGRPRGVYLHYSGAALVVHGVLKGVKVETQADCTPLRSALAFVPRNICPGDKELLPSKPALQACSLASRSAPFRDTFLPIMYIVHYGSMSRNYPSAVPLVRVIVLALPAHHETSNTWCAKYLPDSFSYIPMFPERTHEMDINPLDTLVHLIEEKRTADQTAHQNITSASLEKQEQAVSRDLDILLPVMIRLQLHTMMKTNPVYLALPQLLKPLEQDMMYQISRHYGRLWYRQDQYTLDDDYELVRAPHSCTREDVYQFINQTIRIADTTLHVALPLAYRVGVVVGWLSALSISQPDDAQAGLVILSALVAPLLHPTRSSEVYPTARPGVTEKKSHLLSRPAKRKSAKRK